MVNKFINKILYTIICGILLVAIKSYSQTDIGESHINVTMRMIGHEILLNNGDSTSRVLAIVKEKDRYRIQFESEFHFVPEELVATIGKIVKKTRIANRFLVEVEKCGTKEVIYSYEIGNTVLSDMIPCKTRSQPKSCYTLFFTILDSNNQFSSLPTTLPNGQFQFSADRMGENNFIIIVPIILFIVLIGLFIHFWKKKLNPQKDPDIIILGEYEFDKRNMTLSLAKKRTELTSKEVDLLFLLYTSANTVLDRENILNIVWGDEGDYIGRTLDVFISKLRKKLANDPNLKIINIRGIGYKFIMNNQPHLG